MRKACWIIGTNVLDTTVLTDQDLVTTYKEQGCVERGFRFLKDPLFLASSVTVSKPERIMALSFIMVLCLLIYRLAEFRLRSGLAETRAVHSRSSAQADSPSYHALGLSMF